MAFQDFAAAVGEVGLVAGEAVDDPAAARLHVGAVLRLIGLAGGPLGRGGPAWASAGTTDEPSRTSTRICRTMDVASLMTFR